MSGQPVPKTRKKKPKTPMRACDELFGKLIRSRGACEACGQAFDLQCAHGFSRGYHATRWLERNAFCLCRGCHMKYTHRPIEWEDWMRARLGDYEYDELRAYAKAAPNPPLKETLARLRVRAEQLGVAA